MRRTLFLIGVLFALASTRAQGAVRSASDTLTTVAFEVLPDPYAFTGTVEDRYPDGRLKLLRSIVAGQAEGLWDEWYPTSVLRYLAEWMDGEGEGLQFYFHESRLVRDPKGAETGWVPSPAVRRFATDAVSTPEAQEVGLALSPAGREAFFTRRIRGAARAIYVSWCRDGAWTEAVRASFSTDIDESPSFASGGAWLYG